MHCKWRRLCALLGSARGAAVRSGPDLREPRRGAASFLGCMGVQTEASEERELWSGWNDGDNLRRLPGGGGRAGGEIFRTPGTHTQKCKSGLVTGRRIRPPPRVRRGNVADANRTPGKESGMNTTGLGSPGNYLSSKITVLKFALG